MKDLVSIIIPVYNTEIFLDKCIKSVIGQTYNNIEIIIVNDGSTDNSIKIIKKYANNDKRIMLINQSNQGVSKARNEGIKKAKGKYILFVDGDDYIEPNAVELSLQRIKEYNVDVIKFNVNIYDKDGNVEHENYEGYLGTIFTGKKLDYLISKFLDSESNLHTFAPTLLIKKQKMVEFDESLYFMEDTFFYVKLLKKVDSLCFINEKLYTYVYNEKSASKDINQFNRIIKGLYNTISKIRNELQGESYYNQINYCCFYVFVGKTKFLKAFPIMKIYRSIKESLKGELRNIILENKLSSLSFSKKIQYILIKYKLFFLYSIIIKINKGE